MIKVFATATASLYLTAVCSAAAAYIFYSLYQEACSRVFWTSTQIWVFTILIGTFSLIPAFLTIKLLLHSGVLTAIPLILGIHMLTVQDKSLYVKLLGLDLSNINFVGILLVLLAIIVSLGQRQLVRW